MTTNIFEQYYRCHKKRSKDSKSTRSPIKPSTMDNGTNTREKDMESESTRGQTQKQSTLENIKTIGEMDAACSSSSNKMLGTTAIGSMTSNTVRGSSCGQMATFTKEVGSMTRCRAMENSNTHLDHIMKAIWQITKNKAMAK